MATAQKKEKKKSHFIPTARSEIPDQDDEEKREKTK